ncbi:Uncharacterised protein [Serratia quinivorans]|uniref:hypothetical protein n=1 Tax=Serratia quinivorans TaxID=137545 RepID=UPI00217857AA|nr:hypothetical protein [Serratia quinivorans]CAI1074273.1 Uncharacterised protein [Serratia quinivorans]
MKHLLLDTHALLGLIDDSSLGLIAQAEGLTLISADAAFPQYGIRVFDARR